MKLNSPKNAAPWHRTACAALLVLSALDPAQAQDSRWSVDGRVQVDHASFEGVYSGDGTRADATWLRRAEVKGELRWHPAWRAAAKVEIDGDSQLALSAAFVGWQPRPGWLLRAGRLDPDFGLEPSSSSSWTFGIERSALWDLAPDVASVNEGLGMRADVAGQGFHASAGVYDKRDHRALVARGVWMPRLASAAVLQLGVSVAQSQGWNDSGRLRTRLGVRGVTETDSGRRSTLAAAVPRPQRYSGDRVLGLELAWQHARWTVQAEVLSRQLDGASGAPARSARGAYLLGAWSITGAARRHDQGRARFGRPQGDGGRWAHWETFLRLDTLSVSGGATARVQTLGLSWFGDKTWRAAINLHRASSDDANRVGNTSGHGLTVRVQAVF